MHHSIQQYRTKKKNHHHCTKYLCILLCLQSLSWACACSSWLWSLFFCLCLTIMYPIFTHGLSFTHYSAHNSSWFLSAVGCGDTITIVFTIGGRVTGSTRRWSWGIVLYILTRFVALIGQCIWLPIYIWTYIWCKILLLQLDAQYPFRRREIVDLFVFVLFWCIFLS